ncbi:MAG TPA: HlyD family efflux transporter periplasmic adaptor subunit, partial [Phnomibacter sp.]|nr:HlyD family efflux transporter periplasmic adaptor subunit [Phnomibacter sp.]
MQIEHVSGSIGKKLPDNIRAFELVYERNRKSYTKKWVYIILAIFVIFLFLPWTQNIRARGFITTIRQDDRPQQLNSQIPGKILKWYVKEGDFVQAGDTIVQLGEVKDDYLYPNIIPRTDLQIEQNESKANFYQQKITTVDQQIANLEQQRDLKVASLQNKQVQIERKIQAKKAELAAAQVDLKQSADQLERAKVMLEQEAISKFDYERRNATYQKAQAAATDKQNELANLEQDLLINRLDLNNAQQEYAEKIAKAQGDRFTSSSEVAEAREKVASLTIKKTNLANRAAYYYVLAPQAGQIIKAKKAGINEIIKEGEMIVEIVPADIELAVEMFVSPMDLPLIDTGPR